MYICITVCGDFNTIINLDYFGFFGHLYSSVKRQLGYREQEESVELPEISTEYPESSASGVTKVESPGKKQNSVEEVTEVEVEIEDKIMETIVEKTVQQIPVIDVSGDDSDTEVVIITSSKSNGDSGIHSDESIGSPVPMLDLLDVPPPPVPQQFTQAKRVAEFRR